MKNIVFPLVCIGILTVLFSCNTTPTLESYYIEKSEESSFLVVDIPSSMLVTDALQMSPKQKQALQAFGKLNILAFKATDSTQVLYQKETLKVQQLLANKKQYQELLQVNHKGNKIRLHLAKEDQENTTVNELVFYGKKDQEGFVLARILGDNMQLKHAFTLMELFRQNSFFNSKQVQQLKAFLL